MHTKFLDKFDMPPYGGPRRLRREINRLIDDLHKYGVKPAGPAKGDLSGSYPEPTIGEGKVTEDKPDAAVKAKLVTPQTAPSFGSVSGASDVQSNLTALVNKLKAANVLK